LIDELDQTLHHLLLGRLTRLVTDITVPAQDEQVVFRAPDDAWRTYVKGSLKRPAVSLYLVDVHENVKLRSNQRTRSIENGSVSSRPAPARLDCNYLVTAWSPAQETAGRDELEHGLLYETAAVLLAQEPLVARAVWAPGSPPSAIKTLPLDEPLPVTVARPDGFAHVSHFWSAMGTDARWKPSLWLVVTVPVVLPARVEGPPVTTALADIGTDTLVAIGGTLLDATGTGDPVPVGGARVYVATPSDQRIAATVTDADGRFTFTGLARGGYRLGALATGHGSLQRDLEIPSPTAEYDLRFT
jgi:hypothetical protein